MIGVLSSFSWSGTKHWIDWCILVLFFIFRFTQTQVVFEKGFISERYCKNNKNKPNYFNFSISGRCNVWLNYRYDCFQWNLQSVRIDMYCTKAPFRLLSAALTTTSVCFHQNCHKSIKKSRQWKNIFKIKSLSIAHESDGIPLIKICCWWHKVNRSKGNCILLYLLLSNTKDMTEATNNNRVNCVLKMSIFRLTMSCTI